MVLGMITSAEQFQDYASDCMQWAMQAEMESERDTCIEMAAEALRASTAAGLAVRAVNERAATQGACHDSDPAAYEQARHGAAVVDN